MAIVRQITRDNANPDSRCSHSNVVICQKPNLLLEEEELTKLI